MVDGRTGRVLNAPTLGWRDLDLRKAMASRLNLPIHIERDAVACAMARMWLGGPGLDESRDFVYLIVSEGVGTGLVVNGEPVRGRHHTAGEFGHVPAVPDGPLCSCGSRGCLEAYTSDVATLARYLGIEFEGRETYRLVQEAGITFSDLVHRLRAGDEKAREALRVTGDYLGTGLAGIVNALNPDRVIVGGEIAQAWDFVEPLVRSEIRARALTASASATTIEVDQHHAETRIRGAAALVVAPVFAAPQIA
jgi:predicted NBD/HSP70 family sugar kinase